MNAAVIFLFCLCAGATAARTELHTPAKYKYIPLHPLGVELNPGDTSFTFKVKTKNNAILGFHRFAGNTERDFYYEIAIGAFGNTRSLIRNKPQGNSLKEKNHNPLSNTAFRSFWVSWKDGKVTVGKGKVVGEKEFMSYQDAQQRDVNYISVTSWYDTAGDWCFGSTDPLIVATDDIYHYQPVPDALSTQLQTKKTIIFYMKAANDAHILLQENKGDEKNGAYELVIGGFWNTRSVIRGKNKEEKTHARHNPLSASIYSPFWITTEDSLVSVGEGTEAGRRRFMSYKDESIKANYFSVSTGWNATGSWLFNPM